MAKRFSNLTSLKSNINNQKATVKVKTDFDAATIILNDLNTLTNTKPVGSSIFIVCPFHDDSNPSCSVNVSNTAAVPLGFYHCFSCSAKGPWNKLAEKLNLTIIENWKMSAAASSSANPLTEEMTDVLASLKQLELETDSWVYSSEDIQSNPVFKEIIMAMRIRDTSPWPKYLDWRGFSGDFLKRMGCLLISDSKHQDDYSNNDALFPVFINNSLRGAVKGLANPTKNVPSYITSPGKWIKNHGLMFYDKARELCLVDQSTKYPAVYIVEGTRDALRFYNENYPAIAVLGAEAISIRKLELLQLLNTANLVVVPDNDKGGDVFKKNFLRIIDVYENRESSLPVPITFVDLPKSGGKIDPCSMSDKLFNKLTTMFI